MQPRLAVAAFVSLAAFALGGLAGDPPKAVPHPRFDDRGTLSWSTKLDDAKAAAKTAGKLIFIEYGRES
jgi:hypothetical protein